MNLNSIRIQNLRSLADTGPIELRPINVLVGTNSSGKSTFLRTFPLLRQSVETITTGPILWYGRYADFGTFAQALRRNASQQEISFEFGLTLRSNVERPSYYYYYGRSRVSILNDLELFLTLSLSRRAKDGKTVARRISVNIGADKIQLEADDEGNITGLQVNEFDAVKETKLLTLVPSENLLPQLVVRPETTPQSMGQGQRFPRRYPWSGAFEEALRDAFAPLFATQMSVKRILEIAHRIGLGSPDVQLKQLKQIDGGSVFARRVAGLNTKDTNFRSVRNAVFAYALPRLLIEIDSALTQVFRPVRYIAPVRATAERFYRQQDLAVNEVDPQGANLAMFLQSLSWEEKELFSQWCQEKLGFSVRAQLEGAHISLVLRDQNSSSEYNIADMGFGFSQILPVLAQIWSLTRKTPVRSFIGPNQPRFLREDDESEVAGDIITIEQPELHLHPSRMMKKPCI